MIKRIYRTYNNTKRKFIEEIYNDKCKNFKNNKKYIYYYTCYNENKLKYYARLDSINMIYGISLIKYKI